MSVENRGWQQDVLFRAMGIGLWLIAFLAVRQLFGWEHAAAWHEAMVGEMALAAVGFLGFSLGSVLVFLGAHVGDQVEIAERWRTRSTDRQVIDRLSSEELLAHFNLRSSDVCLGRLKYTNRDS